MKQCRKCLAEGIGPKPREEFSEDKRAVDGLKRSCRAHDKAYYKTYYAANRDKKLASAALYRATHRLPKRVRDKRMAVIYQRRHRLNKRLGLGKTQTRRQNLTLNSAMLKWKRADISIHC